MQILINYGTIIAFLFLTAGICFQIIKTCQRKTVKDISVLEVGLRFLAGTLITIKIIYLLDPYLIIGQAMFTIAFLSYFILVIVYRLKNKSS